MTAPEDEIVYRQLDTTSENPATLVAEAVADIEGGSATDLGTMYECVDGVLDNLFSKPPSPQAQMQISFSYEGYRVTIEQDGRAKFVRTDTE